MPSSATSSGMSFAVAASNFISHVEAEVDDVAVAHHVVLAFQPQLARLLRAQLALAGDEIVERGDLGADEAALEVGMDDAGRLGRGGAGAHRPRAHFLRPGSEV